MSVIHSSNNAAPRKKFGPRGQKAEVCFLGELLLKSSQREFPSQNTPFDNFVTTQPIHKNGNSIDAAGQAQYDAK
jgi:hypothetical protein